MAAGGVSVASDKSLKLTEIDGAPVVAEYRRIVTLLHTSLGTDEVHLFAQPVWSDGRRLAGWRARSGKPLTPASGLPAQARRDLIAQRDRVFHKIEDLIASVEARAGSDDGSAVSKALGAILKSPGGERDLYTDGERPILINWACQAAPQSQPRPALATRAGDLKHRVLGRYSKAQLAWGMVAANAAVVAVAFAMAREELVVPQALVDAMPQIVDASEAPVPAAPTREPELANAEPVPAAAPQALTPLAPPAPQPTTSGADNTAPVLARSATTQPVGARALDTAPTIARLDLAEPEAATAIFAEPAPATAPAKLRWPVSASLDHAQEPALWPAAADGTQATIVIASASPLLLEPADPLAASAAAEVAPIMQYSAAPSPSPVVPAPETLETVVPQAEPQTDVQAEPNPAASTDIASAETEGALGMTRQDRIVLQRRLRLLGFDPHGIDGIFGPRTRTAIADWQRARGFAPTGFFDTDQVRALEAESADRYSQWRAEDRRRAALNAQRAQAERARRTTSASSTAPRHSGGLLNEVLSALSQTSIYRDLRERARRPGQKWKNPSRNRHWR